MKKLRVGIVENLKKLTFVDIKKPIKEYLKSYHVYFIKVLKQRV